jgi:hypothetical protein
MEGTKKYTKHSGRKSQYKNQMGVEEKSGTIILKWIFGKRKETLNWVQ